MSPHNLTCGCCGMGFDTWPEYVDQGQDLDFGICHGCQNFAEEQTNKMLDDSAMQIEAVLNPANKKKFQNMSLESRRHIAQKAHDNGRFTWHIRRQNG